MTKKKKVLSRMDNYYKKFGEFPIEIFCDGKWLNYVEIENILDNLEEGSITDGVSLY
tara:strand:+ start:281 stop:451 length:171 start_codon:yes stop_codon:yes gene_type:complete